MYNPQAYQLGAKRSCIRELFEYGCRRAEIVGRENVYDYSLGNPSIPAPPQVAEAIRQILTDTDSLAIHGYTSAVGALATRQAIADDLNARYGSAVRPQDLFIGCGAAPELVAVFRALAVPGSEFLAIAPFFRNTAPLSSKPAVSLKLFRRISPIFRFPSML